jgi:Flp pilus assembly protein TadG
MHWLLRRLSSDKHGALIAEFAAAMPVLVLLLLGGVEVSRFALLNQRMDRLATVMGDLVAQAETLSESDLTQLFQATGHVAWPFDMATQGVVIISSISIPPPSTTTPKITWQRRTGGLVAGSQIGAQNATLTPPLSGNLTIAVGQTIIVSEVYYEFSPMLVGALVPAHRIYHRAFFRPRIGALTSLSAG